MQSFDISQFIVGSSPAADASASEHSEDTSLMRFQGSLFGPTTPSDGWTINSSAVSTNTDSVNLINLNDSLGNIPNIVSTNSQANNSGKSDKDFDSVSYNSEHSSSPQPISEQKPFNSSPLRYVTSAGNTSDRKLNSSVSTKATSAVSIQPLKVRKALKGLEPNVIDRYIPQNPELKSSMSNIPKHSNGRSNITYELGKQPTRHESVHSSPMAPSDLSMSLEASRNTMRPSQSELTLWKQKHSRHKSMAPTSSSPTKFEVTKGLNPLKHSTPRAVNFSPQKTIFPFNTQSSPSKGRSTGYNRLLKYKNSPPLRLKGAAIAASSTPDDSTRSYISDYTDDSVSYRAEPEWVDVDGDEHGGKTENSRRQSGKGATNSGTGAGTAGNTDPRFGNTVYSNPSIPYTLSLYVQLLFNIFLVSVMIYFFWILVSTIRHDVDQKVEEYSSEILTEMSSCSREYIKNNCMPGRRVPALEHTCNSWEKCMNRDPKVVGRARVSAETFAEIINSFVEPISFKTMFFIGGMISGILAISNGAFAFYRSQQPRSPPQQETHPIYTPYGPAQTPQQFLIAPPVTPYYTPSGGSRMRSSRRSSRRR